MKLDGPEITELASFFYKRTQKLDIERIRLRTGIPTSNSVLDTGLQEWRVLLQHAERMRRLPLLATTIAAQHPEDENLQSVCRLLDDHRQVKWQQAAKVLRGTGVAFVGAGLAGLMMGVLALSASVPDVSIAMESAEAPVVRIRQALTTELQPQTRRPSIRTALSGSKLPTLAKGPKAPLQPQTRRPLKRGLLNSRCGVKSGERVGYFHWGPVAEGKPNLELAIARSVNVRADYPKRDNAYDVRTPVKCILRQGERVKLSQEAILVAGGHYWVPLMAGDLITG
jgi:hypothetical protein